MGQPNTTSSSIERISQGSNRHLRNVENVEHSFPSNGKIWLFVNRNDMKDNVKGIPTQDIRLAHHLVLQQAPTRSKMSMKTFAEATTTTTRDPIPTLLATPSNKLWWWVDLYQFYFGLSARSNISLHLHLRQRVWKSAKNSLLDCAS